MLLVPFKAKEIVGGNIQQLLDDDSEIRRSFFWKRDKQDKRNCVPFSDWNVYHYIQRFLPAFGFYKYRDNEESDFRVIQKKKRRVRIIGDLKDPDTSGAIFNWTLDTLKYLQGTACDLPSQENLEQAIMKKQDLFSKWTMKFLPELPEVASEDENGKEILIPQRPLKDNPHLV